MSVIQLKKLLKMAAILFVAVFALLAFSTSSGYSASRHSVITRSVKNNDLNPPDIFICDTDRDCPEDRYCHDVSNLCAECVNCAKYNRQKARIRCARDALECGDCLPGYITLHFNEHEKQLRCSIYGNSIVRAPVAHQNESPLTKNTLPLIGWIISVLTMMLSIFAFVFLLYKLKGQSFARGPFRNSSRYFQRPAPPTYADATTGSAADNGQNQARDFHLEVFESSENKQHAVPFRMPDYMYDQPCSSNQTTTSVSLSEQEPETEMENPTSQCNDGEENKTKDGNDSTNELTTGLNVPQDQDSVGLESSPVFSPHTKRRRIDDSDDSSDSGGESDEITVIKSITFYKRGD